MAVAAAVCAVTVLIAAIALMPAKSSDGSHTGFSEVGYDMDPAAVSEKFTSSSTAFKLTVDDPNLVRYSKTEGGLKVDFGQNSSSLYISKGSTGGNSVRCVLDASSVDGSHYLDLNVKFRTGDHPSWYYGVTVRMTPNKVILIPDVWLGTGTPEYQNFAFMYDVSARGSLDILVEVRDGNIKAGIDGFEYTLRADYKVFNDLMFDLVTLSTNKAAWSSPAAVVLEKLEIGNGAQITYRDRLHKTTTAWGHDFTLALQIHADQANAQQLALLKQLADSYGVRGEFEAWMNTMDTDVEYSVLTSEAYASALTDLQSSGWDIGLHAVTSNPSTRSEMLPLIDQFEQRYGPLRSWVDHGEVLQDIWEQGNDPTSPYYISDLLVDDEVMIWVNQEEHSHSKVQDLNLDRVMYHNDSYPGLDLMRASHYGFLEETNDWQPAYSPVTSDELSDRQRVYASNSAVLIWHDYSWRFLYIEDGGVNYSVQSHANMGYPYELITAKEMAEEGANVHPNGTWKIQPVAEDYFSAMRDDYDVWYATPREVYERSIAVGEVELGENSTAVTVENQGNTAVMGMTLFTKERPDYCLRVGSTYYYADQGAENWQFVIPQLPVGSLVLEKVAMPSSAPTVTDDSAQVSMWTEQGTLYLRANRDGTVVLDSKVSGGDLKIVELGTGQERAYHDGDAVTMTAGRTYVIMPN